MLPIGCGNDIVVYVDDTRPNYGLVKYQFDMGNAGTKDDTSVTLPLFGDVSFSVPAMLGYSVQDE